MQGWGGSCRGEIGHAGLGWVMQSWGGSCRVGWGGSCRGGVGSEGVEWVNAIHRVSNLSTNIRVWELQCTESRHATGYQI